MAAASALFLIGAAFLPWIHIAAPDLTLTGVNDMGSDYGPRGRGQIYFAIICLVMLLINRNWSMLFAIVIAAINVAFALSHLYVYRCYGGICPQKLYGLYFSLAASFLLLVFLLYAPVRPEPKNED